MGKINSVFQTSLIIVAIAALLGLYFFGKTTQPLSLEQAASAMREEAQAIELDTEQILQNAINQLTDQEMQSWETKKTGQQVAFWQSVDRNDVAAIYAKQIAEQNNNFEFWNQTGDLSVRAFREVVDTTQKHFFIQEAVSSYQKALEHQQDISTKLKLAKLYTSISGATMDGVLLLREIVEEDPKHIQANYELGLLSMQSGQADKALERFDLLIEEEPEFIEPYILKAQLLLNENKNLEAKSVLDAAIANTNNKEGLQVLQEMKNSIK